MWIHFGNRHVESQTIPVSWLMNFTKWFMVLDFRLTKDSNLSNSNMNIFWNCFHKFDTNCIRVKRFPVLDTMRFESRLITFDNWFFFFFVFVLPESSLEISNSEKFNLDVVYPKIKKISWKFTQEKETFEICEKTKKQNNIVLDFIRFDSRFPTRLHEIWNFNRNGSRDRVLRVGRSWR